MKKSILYMVLAASLIFTGCTKNFDKINTDPTKVSAADFDPNYLFTYAELDYSNMTETQLYEFSCMTQLFANATDYYGGGDKYDSFLTSYNSTFFTDGMTDAGQLIAAEKLAQSKDPNQYSNLVQMSRIMWVLIMERMTDIYGDIPYSQAGLGAYGIPTPVYDTQASIYPAMLSQLADAINKLDASKPLAAGDLLYAGNIAQWKKFGYSVMLRIAMRLTKVDLVTAQKYAEMAAGNTFTSIADNAMVKLTGGPNALTINKTADEIFKTDFAQVRWSSTFINYLKADNDPRLYALTERADTGLAFNNDVTHAGVAYTAAQVPQGMPNGYDLSGPQGIATAPGYPGPTGSIYVANNATVNNINPIGNYARPKLAAFTKLTLPVFMITYAQTELLEAEVAARGWNAGGVSAAQHFTNGVQGALQTISGWDPSLAIPDTTITSFIGKYTLDVSSLDNSLKMINSEYWVASIFDFPEAWDNWRRSGYPVLTPVNYPGNITNGTIPRRLPYPLIENTSNAANYQAALKRMGGTDLPTTRMWWDKK